MPNNCRLAVLWGRFVPLRKLNMTSLFFAFICKIRFWKPKKYHDFQTYIRIYQIKIHNLLLQYFKFLKSETVQRFLSNYFTIMMICRPDCLSRTFQIGSLQKLTMALKFVARGRKIDFLISIRTLFQILIKCGSIWSRSIYFII